MNNKVQLRVLGLSYARLKNSAYMLILAEVGGPRHINMWIGEAEAHSIAIAMEGVKPPRPITHDLFVSFAHAFGVKLEEVFIYNVEDEIYSSELKFSDGQRTVAIDSRTSDGIAIAMRTNAPIYTTEEILRDKGFLLEMERRDSTEEGGREYAEEHKEHSPRLEQYSVEELEKMLAELIDSEDYEQAAKVNEILQRKRGGDA